jgi:hypothetical protein
MKVRDFSCRPLSDDVFITTHSIRDSDNSPDVAIRLRTRLRRFLRGE